MSDGTDLGVPRVIEQYRSVVDLERDMLVRNSAGWFLLSAGEVCPGCWWEEYDRLCGLA